MSLGRYYSFEGFRIRAMRHGLLRPFRRRRVRVDTGDIVLNWLDRAVGPLIAQKSSNVKNWMPNRSELIDRTAGLC